MATFPRSRFPDSLADRVAIEEAKKRPLAFGNNPSFSGADDRFIGGQTLGRKVLAPFLSGSEAVRT